MLAIILLNLITITSLFSQYDVINASYDFSFRQIDGSVVNIDSLNLPVFIQNDTIIISFTHTGIDTGQKNWLPTNFVRYDTTVINAQSYWTGNIFNIDMSLKLPFGNWQLRARTNGSDGTRTDYSNRVGLIVATRNPKAVIELMLKLKVKIN